jgi:hypothetical protein
MYMRISVYDPQFCFMFPFFISYCVLHPSISVATHVGRFTELHCGPITYHTHMYLVVPNLFYLASYVLKALGFV